MKTGWRFIWMLALMLAACSGDKGSETPAAGAREKKTAPAPTPRAPNKAPTPAQALKVEPETPVMTIKRRLAIELGDGTEGPAAAIALEVMPGDVVQGTLDLAGSPLSLTGIKQDNQLRMWVVGGAVNETPLRRGYLLGTLDGDEIKGTIAISGNGGKSAMQGSWSSVD